MIFEGEIKLSILQKNLLIENLEEIKFINNDIYQGFINFFDK